MIAIIFCIVGFITSGSAQPVLNYSSTNSIGTQCVLYYIGGTTTELAQSGANVTWNLSANTCASVGTFNAVDPLTTPYTSSYSSANLAYNINVINYNPSYVYLINSTTEQNKIAEDIGGTSPVIYTNYVKSAVFPFNYLDTFSDISQTSTGSPISCITTYDAYGTLIINGKTYNNVIRISLTTGKIGWYITSPAMFPVIWMSGGSYFYNEPTTYTGIDDLNTNNQVTIYPNPAKDRLNINLGNTAYDFLEIYTSNSKLIEKTKINLRENIELNLENKAKGIYFIKFSGKDNLILRKIVKL